jgi:hypothetical protein
MRSAAHLDEDRDRLPVDRNHHGGASNDIETPCALRSGEYDYEIWLFRGPGMIDNPDSRIPGKIVVK